MTTVRKSTLSMQQRLDILKELETQSISCLAEKYGVHPITIRRIRQNAPKISVFADKDRMQKNRRTLRAPMYAKLEQCLLSWFSEKKALGHSVTDALLIEKAAELKDNIPSCANFKVSNGWLLKFKRRHSIRFSNWHAEKSYVDENAARTFVSNFRKLIEEEKLGLENIYNMGESSLMWKAVLPKMPDETEPNGISEKKVNKEKVTIALCANALGTHKLIPFLIYKYRNPRALKHCMQRLPVIFKAQTNASMDEPLFSEWFDNYFKPSVRAYHLEKGIHGKVILLLDNCIRHKLPSERQEDDQFEIMYLPSNTASLIQPFDQGIMKEIKQYFRRKMLQSISTYDGDENEFYKHYTIKDCVDIVHSAWSQVTSESIINAWHNIIARPVPSSDYIQEHEQDQCDLQEMNCTIPEVNINQQLLTDFSTMAQSAEGTLEGEQDQHILPETIYNITKLETTQQDDTDSSLVFAEAHNFIQEGVVDVGECKMEGVEEEKNGIIKQRTSEPDQNALNELNHIFQRLIYYSANAPRFIRLSVESLQDFFLGTRDDYKFVI